MSIWKYKKLNNLVEEEYQLTLGEGDTPLEEYEIDGKKVFIKREDKNPNGSFKDRSLAFQISKLFEDGHKHLVISSSGNAAISAAAYCELAEIKLDIFVSNNIEQAKLDKLSTFNSQLVTLYKSDRAKSDAIKFAVDNNIPNLRGSMDDDAIIGFKTISYELAKQNPEIDAIFIPCSSGTSTVGIYQGYQDLIANSQPALTAGRQPTANLPNINICQTERIHPIAKEFDQKFTESEKSLAPAISDRVAKRKSEVISAISETNGSGWIIADKLLEEAKQIAKDIIGEDISYNSLLSLASYLKSKKQTANSHQPIANNPCLLFSGL